MSQLKEDSYAELHGKLYPHAAAKEEYIICAAIWFKDEKKHVHQPLNVDSGFVICGRRHHNCFVVLSIFNVPYIKSEQGFLTSKDRFLTRKEAGEMAFKNKQTDQETDCLFSEDLY